MMRRFFDGGSLVPTCDLESGFDLPIMVGGLNGFMSLLHLRIVAIGTKDERKWQRVNGSKVEHAFRSWQLREGARSTRDHNFSVHRRTDHCD